MNWEDKNQIWRNLKGKSLIDYEENQIFQDLSQETLRRRRALKPLLPILCEHQVQYNWSFPACLIGIKNGCTATLRFIEDTVDFCRKLDIPISKDCTENRLE